MISHVSFFGRYVIWHYTRALTELTTTGATLVWFVGRFFSIGTLIRTFFSPWKRMAESYPSIVDIGHFIETFIVNTLMRAIGMITRTVLIFIGLIALFISSLLYVCAFIVWIFAPLLLAWIIGSGVYLLFS
ncbi:MAG: hypothetical protein HGB03_03925 [Candidatus Yonathbacteria bacterium]|nr:hypothetical protein [Candidatus Yonathbacteria bacterium]NTW47620.1 hypothetical protein [Candidatus Yonathbacteria bacterium]